MQRNQIALKRAFGSADLAAGEPLTPRHRFRIASHSKSFTAAGVMKLREAGKLRLDDPIGQYVKGLHPQIAEATVSQLLSHSAGIVRDGADAGYFEDRRPFPSTDELLADLQEPPVIERNTRHKYSNHGFGLLGLAIEAITGESYRSWIKREIVEAAGLEETEPDMPIPDGVRFARGHTGELLLGKRLVIPGDYALNAVAPAGGFVSTAADLAKHFAQLAPDALRSVLSADSRREMTRRHWRNPHSSAERHYGLGVMIGNTEGWDWFGHGGGLQGYASFTCVVPERELTVCILVNASDGWAGYWVEGALHLPAVVAAMASACGGCATPPERSRKSGSQQQGACRKQRRQPKWKPGTRREVSDGSDCPGRSGDRHNPHFYCSRCFLRNISGGPLVFRRIPRVPRTDNSKPAAVIRCYGPGMGSSR